MESQPDRSYVRFLAATAALGGLLFGFDVGMISGAGPFLVQHFQLSDLSLGWAFSVLLFGCVIGSFLAGQMTEIYGRRNLLLWVALIFGLTSLATGLAPSFPLLLLARGLGGLAVGGASILAPMYVAEVSPPPIRGRMSTLFQLSMVSGILVSSLINYLLRNTGDWNWRWMFISGLLPSALYFMLLLRAPESPRFLLKVGRYREAYAILERMSGPRSAMREIEVIHDGQQEGSWRDLLKPGQRRSVVIGVIMAILIHATGINTIINYAPGILKSAGYTVDSALLSTFLLGAINVLFTWASFGIIDRFGRKPLYLIGSVGMGSILAILAGAALSGRFSGPMVLGLIMGYLAFFSACIGPIFWTLISEMAPNRNRGLAMSVPVLTQWIANALVVLFFPLVFNQVGVAGTFSFLAVMCLIQALFTWHFVPETKGKSLEEIERQFLNLSMAY